MNKVAPENTQAFQNTDLTLLTMGEVAAVLRVNRSTVSRLLQHLPGEAPELAYIGLGGRKMVRYRDLVQFIDKRRVGSE